MILAWRTPFSRLSSLDRLAESGFDLSNVWLDLDNTLLPYKPGPSDLELLAGRLRTLRELLPTYARMTLTTNTRTHPPAVAQAVATAGLQIVARAGKPRLGRLSAEAGLPPTVVVGDQPLTDGLLAWRLRVPLILATGCSSREPPWPRLMRVIGYLLLPLFFKEVSLASPGSGSTAR